jgi:hypothetical protein
MLLAVFTAAAQARASGSINATLFGCSTSRCSHHNFLPLAIAALFWCSLSLSLLKVLRLLGLRFFDHTQHQPSPQLGCLLYLITR